jgi:hypothetical protein
MESVLIMHRQGRVAFSVKELRMIEMMLSKEEEKSLPEDYSWSRVVPTLRTLMYVFIRSCNTYSHMSYYLIVSLFLFSCFLLCEEEILHIFNEHFRLVTSNMIVCAAIIGKDDEPLYFKCLQEQKSDLDSDIEVEEASIKLQYHVHASLDIIEEKRTPPSPKFNLVVYSVYSKFNDLLHGYYHHDDIFSYFARSYVILILSA